MKLPLGFGEIDFTDWFRGLMAAFIGGGASAVSAGFVVSAKDPAHYALGSANFFQVAGSVFLVSGTINAAAFLRTKPIPDMKTVTTSIAVSQQGKSAPVTVATVTEVHQEPTKP